MRTYSLITGFIAFAVFAFFTSTAFAEGAAPDPAKLYKKCMGCHGKDGKGNPKFRAKKNPNLPDFTDAAWQKKTPAAQIKKSIADGKPSPCKEGDACNVEKSVYKGKMKGYSSKFSAAEIDALVKHVQGFAK